MEWCGSFFHGTPNYASLRNYDVERPHDHAPDMNRFFGLSSADLVVPNMDAWNLMLDLDATKQFTDTLPGNTQRPQP